MEPIVFEEELVDVDTEDAGMAKIGHIYSRAGVDDPNAGQLFVRIQSWSEPNELTPLADPTHPEFEQLVGKRVRVTIEVIETDEG
jgi:hypothetical protein